MEAKDMRLGELACEFVEAYVGCELSAYNTRHSSEISENFMIRHKRMENIRQELLKRFSISDNRMKWTI